MALTTKRKSVLTALLALFILAGSYVWQMEVRGNFRVIEPDKAYRSGQLSCDKLVNYVTEYKIKSILNLRGANPGQPWYDQEKEIARSLNIKHYDIALSASEEPTPEQVRQIIEVFDEAPRPLLIHCKAGADRSGLVSAMWKMAVEGADKEEAVKQLSIFYGHMPIGNTTAMDDFFIKWNPQ